MNSFSASVGFILFPYKAGTLDFSVKHNELSVVVGNHKPRLNDIKVSVQQVHMKR